MIQQRKTQKKPESMAKFIKRHNKDMAEIKSYLAQIANNTSVVTTNEQLDSGLPSKWRKILFDGGYISNDELVGSLPDILTCLFAKIKHHPSHAVIKQHLRKNNKQYSDVHISNSITKAEISLSKT
jgi:tetrahydromethanopterin S-methyltransferase subunit F